MYHNGSYEKKTLSVYFIVHIFLLCEQEMSLFEIKNSRIERACVQTVNKYKLFVNISEILCTNICIIYKQN